MKSLPSKIGPILGFIGGLVMVVFKIIFLITESDPNPTMLLSISVSMLWGVLAIVGFIIALKEKDIGYYLVFVAGVGSLVGIFIPVQIPFLNYIQSLKLTQSFYFIDVALMLLGGILSLISVRKD